MKKIIMIILSLGLFLSGCVNTKLIQQGSLTQETDSRIENFNFWLDEETGTVHKISGKNGREKVVSIIKYRKGIPLEEMKIISSDHVNGNIHWIYFVPTTGYTVELIVLSRYNNTINIEWKNRDESGVGDSGSDKLIMCDENGFIKGALSFEKDDESTEDFSTSDNID